MSRLPRERRGAVAPLVGLLLPVLLLCTALVADLAVLAVARSQLSVAADAAALAGAAQLGSARRTQTTITDLAPEITAANTQAASFAAQNFVLHQPAALLSNTGNSPGGDITVGYLDTTRPGMALSTAPSDLLKFNSVQVTARRDLTHTGLVPAFFARIIGYGGTALSVQSRATLQPYVVMGFSGPAQLMPIALDSATWAQMVAKTTVDRYTWDPVTHQVSTGPDGSYESQLFPVQNGATGNWGTLQIGVGNAGNQDLGAQIANGVTAAQIANIPGGLQMTGTPPSITFMGNPGISGGLKTYLDAAVGKPVFIPIYDQTSGGGTNSPYRIIAFQPGVIVAVNGNGGGQGNGNNPNPMTVTIQPAVIDGSNTIVGATTDWTGGGALKLCLTK
jgi:Flp pilus assembly protein TadG